MMSLMQTTPGHFAAHGSVLGTQEERASEFVKDCLSFKRASFSGMEREEGERESVRMKKRRNKRTAAIAGPATRDVREEMDRCSERLMW